jgi:hypothetical protein
VAIVRTLIGRLLVLALAWMLTPGLTETAENLWHLAVAGHTAHARASGEDHAPQGDEHGCTGTFHLCLCHISVTPVLAASVAVGYAPQPAGLPASFRASPPPDPLRAAPDRPPRA